MSFLYRNRIGVLFSAAIVILIAALFWPEKKKPGEVQKYYSQPQQQLQSLEFQGEMALGEKLRANVHYVITREENPVKPKEPVYRIEIRKLAAADVKSAKRAAELSRLKTFYASALIRTIVQDWSEPDFYFELPHEAARDREYGIEGCRDQVTITFRSATKQFCIGKATSGDTRRYVLDKERDKLLLTPDFTVRRLLNNIYAQRDQSLQPYGTEGFDLIEMKIHPQELAKYPMLRGKTGGNLALRMLVKDEGKNKVNVWHVDKLLSIMPSHAAEFAQLISALRVNAPMAVDAKSAEQRVAELAAKAGLAAGTVPAVSGTIKLKKTDKQDLILTNFAFFAPAAKPAAAPAFQFDQQIVRPQDTLIASGFNAGYIAADLYPRLTGILIKMENDLLEAQKKGEQDKAVKATKETKKEKAPPAKR